MKNILITGGAGFIGSHLVKHFTLKYPNYKIINFDILSYASDLSRLSTIENNKNYNFIKGDINDTNLLNEVFKKFKIDSVINLAAESHVDNSIKNPNKFAETNIMGTLNLLNISNKFWQNSNHNLFYHISTDEVYGELGEKGLFSESTAYNPKSPYSASKASSDHLTRAFHHTFKLPIIISNCSNNYGPDQHFEKLIPLTIKKIINNEKIPIYGDGKNIRDWIFVKDHVDAIDKIFHSNMLGETFNIGGENEINNLDLVTKIIEITDAKLGRNPNSSVNLISFVEDRKGHDFRYAIDNTKINNQLGWYPKTTFMNGLEETVESYIYKS
ncbi:dTDP-glucose 4,6-dehydratase [Flavobacteriaceae bacterium]|nr:dTDP-glucose 4,6-dehydratase [Flavobacteriaceae bacterium]